MTSRSQRSSAGVSRKNDRGPSSLGIPIVHTESCRLVRKLGLRIRQKPYELIFLTADDSYRGNFSP